ncbi:MAG TPA: hypothetical protein VHI52_14600 [Verrucomicrobiae bacterium]|nr:hypothetical protein [Verrucomicrobiae bacterium]
MYNECRHIFTSGRKCQSPALKDQPFCYFHSNTRKRPTPANQPYEPYIESKEAALQLPPLEDADAIQLALTDVILALAANRIDQNRARILIYGLQVASQNHRHRSKEQEPAQTVREANEHLDGTLIGPVKETPDPEEVAKSQRPPSLGEILLREAEALRAKKEVEKEVVETRQAEKLWWEKSQPGIVDLQAATEPSIQHPHPDRSRRTRAKSRRVVEGTRRKARR